jgi:hypothetical protein
VKTLNLGELRALTKDLPDSTEIRPDWDDDGPPSDEEPGIKVTGFAITDRRKDGPYLSVLVNLFYLSEIDPDDEESDPDEPTTDFDFGPKGDTDDQVASDVAKLPA